MSAVLAGTIGAAIGLVVAMFGNVVVLPYVLRSQDRAFAGGWRMPVFGWDKERMAAVTKLFYRVPLPLLFALVGAIVGVQILGGSK